MSLLPHNAPRWLLTVTGLAVTVVVVVVGRPGDEVPPQELSAQSDRPARAEPAGHPMSLPLPEPKPATVDTLPRGGAASTAILEDFWGGRWSAVRDELTAAGFDPDNLPPIWPWEEAAPMLDWYLTLTADDRIESVFGSMIDWPSWTFRYAGRAYQTHRGGFRTAAAKLAFVSGVRNADSLDEPTAEAILAAADPLNHQLEAALLEYLPQLEARLRQKFQAGVIERAPLRLRPVERRPDFGASLYGVRPAMLGWQVEDTLSRKEAPYLAELCDRIEALKAERAAFTYTLVTAHLDAVD